MEGHKDLDPVDRQILQILSLYEDLDLLQLWYELGESDGLAERMTPKEVFKSLETLSSQGFVEHVGEGERGIRWAVSSRGKVER